MIHKKRIRSLTRNFPQLKLNNPYYFAVKINEVTTDKAIKLGFTTDFNIGERLLPNKEFGKVSKYNAKGKEVINKAKGKKDYTYSTLWTHQEFRGRGETEEVTSVVNRTIKRWHRDFVNPPEVYLTIINNNTEKFIAAPLTIYNESNKTLMIHMVNLLLEIFEECDILDEKIANIITPVKITHLNWEILPDGKDPFCNEHISDITKNMKLDATESHLLRNRMEIFKKYPASHYYMGIAGFSGYMIMEYKELNILLLENFYYGNATYIFSGTFEINNFYSLTKKDIFDNNLHEDRIIHNKGWDIKIMSIFQG